MDIFLKSFKTAWKKFVIVCFVIILLFFYGVPKLSLYLQSRFLSTPANGIKTPETYGISSERVRISSDHRFLDASIVIAPSTKQTPDVVLIFHGSEETISCWAFVQKILYDQGISSLVFDYSGFGNSSHPGSIKNLNKDALSVYSYSVSKFKNDNIYVLGFSLGNAPMLASIHDFKPAPSGVIVGSAFSSLRELGKYSGKTNGLFKTLINFIPDVWNNTLAIKDNFAPLLVLHSDSDASNPLFMGQKIHAAANNPKQFVLLHGLKHNAPIGDSCQTWWKPVIQFIENGH
jgi:hypothetical protein